MPTKSSKTVKRASAKKEQQTRREIFGVCMIAFALLFAAAIYTDKVGVVGAAIKSLIFGAFGVIGYGIPFVLIAIGIAAFFLSKFDLGTSTLVLAICGIISLLTIIHTASRGAITSDGVWAYYSDAYLYGKLYYKGGGFIGSLLTYPSVKLLDVTGTYIVFVAAALIFFLLATRLSIRGIGERLGHTIKAGVDNVAEHVRRLDYDDADYYYEAQQPKRPVQKPITLSEEIDVSDLTPETVFSSCKRTSTRKKKAPVSDGYIVQSRATQKRNGWDSDISLIPASGGLKKKNADSTIDDDPFDILDGIKTKDEPAPEETPAAEVRHTVKETTKKAGIDVEKAAAEAAKEITPEPPAYKFPPITFLNEPERMAKAGKESPQAKGRKLEETLASFNIDAKVINYSVGPVITRFELHPAQGVRVNRITSLSDDIALALAAPRVRIEAPIPGKSAIGIEIPNKDTVPVLLREIIASKEFREGKAELRFGIGKDIAGNVLCADLDRMPHMLIAGSTGSGKSVCINDIILSFVYGKTPDEVRLIMVDPKKVELKVYSPLPHLLMPVVTDAKKAAGALKWAVMEMEQRYAKMSTVNARDITRYNSLQTEKTEILPRLVIIIDELADLMMVAAKDVEESICRIAQLGRAAGIHLIVATQRPSTDIITGLIKANIPSRIALAVSSGVDSRVIMDTNGAEKLLGRGDMLFHANGANKPVRAQAAFVSDEEVERVMEFFSEEQTEKPSYVEVKLEDQANGALGKGNGKQEDELLDDAVKIVLESGQASISMIQRRLRVGYARAARLIDIMEQLHVVSGFDGSKPRKLLVASFEEYRQLTSGGEDEE